MKKTVLVFLFVTRLFSGLAQNTDWRSLNDQNVKYYREGNYDKAIEFVLIE